MTRPPLAETFWVCANGYDKKSLGAGRKTLGNWPEPPLSKTFGEETKNLLKPDPLQRLSQNNLTVC